MVRQVDNFSLLLIFETIWLSTFVKVQYGLLDKSEQKRI